MNRNISIYNLLFASSTITDGKCMENKGWYFWMDGSSVHQQAVPVITFLSATPAAWTLSTELALNVLMQFNKIWCLPSESQRGSRDINRIKCNFEKKSKSISHVIFRAVPKIQCNMRNIWKSNCYCDEAIPFRPFFFHAIFLSLSWIIFSFPLISLVFFYYVIQVLLT